MVCSVCAEDVSTPGGVLLWERNGLVSAICEECWITFSNIKPFERSCKNDSQLAAMMANIGVETQLFYKEMSRLKPFSENLHEARTKFKYQIQTNPLCTINVDN